MWACFASKIQGELHSLGEYNLWERDPKGWPNLGNWVWLEDPGVE
jgi:hypothetical protein